MQAEAMGSWRCRHALIVWATGSRYQIPAGRGMAVYRRGTGTMPRLSASVIGLIVGLATLSGVLAGPAAAHPHVWITVETMLLYDKGTFTGLRHKWTFDQYYTAMAIEGLDKNKDGKYDREELAELAKVNID